MKLGLITALGLSMMSAAFGADRPVVTAHFLEGKPAMDGRIDPQFWERTEKVALTCSRDKSGQNPVEGGRVALGWHASGLYLAARLIDSELVATVLRDEEMHYQYGDVLELFVKPLERPCYWEMYVTPAGHKSTLFFRRPMGEKQPDPLTGHEFHGLAVAAKRRPASAELAAGWDAEMWVPAEQLASSGESWGAGGKWTVFFGRYNHVASLKNPELSMWPPASRTKFHLTEEYARVRFEPAR